MRWNWCRSVWEGWATNHPQPHRWQSTQDGLCHWGLLDGWYYENLISLILSPLTISGILSSLYTRNLPNQIMFVYWTRISEDLKCIVTLIQGSGLCPDLLLLTFAWMWVNATKDANWLVRMNTWLGQAQIPLQKASWAQLVCGLTTEQSTKAVLRELHGISFVSKRLHRHNDLEEVPHQLLLEKHTYWKQWRRKSLSSFIFLQVRHFTHSLWISGDGQIT